MIIGISGKKQSGKDTIGKIIQYLISKRDMTLKTKDTFKEFMEFCKSDYDSYGNWQIKKFADPLKDIVCILTGCTREQLEDEAFKNTFLPEEWNKSTVMWIAHENYKNDPRYVLTKNENGKEFYVYTEIKQITYRELLQTVGTDLFRNILHEETWINALMADYNPVWTTNKGEHDPLQEAPNWIITDVRFPNEAKAVKDRGGIMIRVNRSYVNRAEVLFDFGDTLLGKNTTSKLINLDHSEPHQSETALDDYEFEHVIQNDGTIEDLITKIKNILSKDEDSTHPK